jgi:hypothetical protein
MRIKRTWSRRDPEQIKIITKVALQYGVDPQTVIQVIANFFRQVKVYLPRYRRISIPGLFTYSLIYNEKHQLVILKKKKPRKKRKKKLGRKKKRIRKTCTINQSLLISSNNLNNVQQPKNN